MAEKKDIPLSDSQKIQYRKQLALPGMSEEAQLRLISSTVLILGMRWTGLTVAKQLSLAGVGKIVLLDENPKLLSDASRAIAGSAWSNKDSEIICRAWSFEAQRSEQMIADADVVVDCLDNWQQKLLASDVCMLLDKPLVHAGGSRFRFQTYMMVPGKSACLRCAFPQAGIDDVPLEAPDDAGLVAIMSMVAAIQAIDTIKVIARLGISQGNELHKFDFLSGEFESIRGLDPRRDCPDCGRTNSPRI
jgi:molybdopterin/thiamine biosynthesis adenylyltransferase